MKKHTGIRNLSKYMKFGRKVSKLVYIIVLKHARTKGRDFLNLKFSPIFSGEKHVPGNLFCKPI